jgi:hypothetical protein
MRYSPGLKLFSWCLQHVNQAALNYQLRRA